MSMVKDELVYDREVNCEELLQERITVRTLGVNNICSFRFRPEGRIKAHIYIPDQLCHKKLKKSHLWRPSRRASHLKPAQHTYVYPTWLPRISLLHAYGDVQASLATT